MPAVARQLNINLPADVADELERLARNSNLTMEQVVQTALALVKIAADANGNKQRLVVADQSGKPLKEIVLPK